MNRVLSRLILFRRQIVTLWRAFWHPATPFHLKAIMVGVVVYVISPVDLMPDFLVGLGWIDDILLVTFAVNWIIKRLPGEIFEQPRQRPNFDESERYRQSPDNSGAPTIDGSSRRL